MTEIIINVVLYANIIINTIFSRMNVNMKLKLDKISAKSPTATLEELQTFPTNKSSNIVMSPLLPI